MATIKYLLQSESNNAPIYLRLSLNRDKAIKRKTGLSIDYKKWSKATGLPKQNDADNKRMTTKLKELENAINKKVNDSNLSVDELDGDWLNDAIDIHFQRKTTHSQSELLSDAIQSLIDDAPMRKNAMGSIGLSTSRINAYKGLKRIFDEYRGNKKIKVKDVDVKFAKEFLKHLLHTKKYQKSYALKKVADLKTVCYDAETNGIEVNFQLKKIESSKPQNDNIIYLDTEELQAIENADLQSDALQNARKWLLLGCNIGQRGGDLLNLNESNFVTRHGLQVIELKQQKTGKNVTIPLLQTTAHIVRTGLPYKISIQKLNEYVKKICKIAEINKHVVGGKFDDETKRKKTGTFPKHELITSHVCRRSFASNQYGKLPTALIMQITGHSTEKMLLNYIGKNSMDYAQQIADYYAKEAKKENKETTLRVVKEAQNF